MNYFRKVIKIAIVVASALVRLMVVIYQIMYKKKMHKQEENNQYDGVVADSSAAIESDNHNGNAYQRRGRALMELNQLEAAIEDAACAYCLLKSPPAQELFEEVIAMKSERDAAALMKTREPGPVSVEFTQSYIRSFRNDPVFNAAGEHAQVATGIVRSEPRSAFQEACAKLVMMEYNDVIPHLNQELEHDDSPYRKEALLMRATFYGLSGCPDRADIDLTALLAMPVMDIRLRSTALMKRGLLKSTTLDPKKGLDDMMHAGKIDPMNTDIFHHRGKIALLMQDMEQATKDTSRALELQKPGDTNPSTFFHKYLCDLLLATPQSAVKAILSKMDAGCTKYPKDVECWYIYTHTLLHFGLFEKAEAIYTRAVALLPQTAKVYVQQAATILAWKNDTTKAMEYLNRARNADPYSEEVYESLGLLHLQQNKLHEAVEAFKMQVKYSKTEIECQNTMALIEAVKAQIFIKAKFRLTSSGILNRNPGKTN